MYWYNTQDTFLIFSTMIGAGSDPNVLGVHIDNIDFELTTKLDSCYDWSPHIYEDDGLTNTIYSFNPANLTNFVKDGKFSSN